MPPTSDGGDTPPVPPLPPFLVPPGSATAVRAEWTSSPARPVSVVPTPSAIPAFAPVPPSPPTPAVPVYAAPSPPVHPAVDPDLDAAPDSVADPLADLTADPTTDLEYWGPASAPPAAEVEQRRPLLKVLWPWGVRGILESVEVLLLALVMFAFVRSIGQNFVVYGGSMEPTFHNGEMLIVNKIVYRTFDVSWLPWSDNADWRPFGAPRPGDVVVFQFPQNPSRDLIKRVIAVEGQTVEVRGGKLIIDGEVHPEPFLSQPPAYDYGPATVPSGQYFVLGDNRNNSYDSHAWGMLDDVFMIGRAELRYWPPERAGRVGNEDPIPTPQAGVSRSP